MKKILKSLLTASLVTLTIHLVIIFIQFIIIGFQFDEVFEIATLSIPFILMPTFFAFTFYNKQKDFKKMVFTIFLYNFVTIFIYVYCYFKFFEEDESHTLLSFQNFIIPIISSFISLFFVLYQKISQAKIDKNQLSKPIKFSYIQLFLIALSGVILYIVVVSIGYYSFFDSVQIVYKFLPIGFIFSMVSIHFFKYVYQQFHFSKRKLYVVLYYIISIFLLVFWIIISVNNFRIVKSGLSAVLDRAFLIPSILLYAPFFTYVLICTHLYFIQLINKQEKKFLTQQSLESQLNYQQLKNQISPHFLFNNINVLTSLIEENPKKAVLFSENLSNIYRYFLEQEKQDVVLVKDEIEFAKSYLELLKDRFEIGFNYTISVDEKVNENYVVATILQQVLENVVKHNIINENNIVDVKITSKENYLIVENNKNFKSLTSQNSKKGIENIKQRIAYFTDKKVFVENSKTYFVIQLPILETV